MSNSQPKEFINGLSLCAGVGGLDLGLEIAFPGYRAVAGIEHNEQAAQRFRLRYPAAKVFRDVVGFDARRLNGLVDCVSAGWPCQPHSVAGKRLGTADERWIWEEIARVLGETGAPLFFGENVSGLLRDTDRPIDRGELEDESEDVMGGMGTVLRDLAALGFVSVWGSLRAANVGASHGRPRVFILAYKPGRGLRINGRPSRGGGHADERHGRMANAGSGQLPEPWRGEKRRDGARSAGALLEYSEDDNRRGRVGRAQETIGADGIGRRGPAGAVGELANSIRYGSPAGIPAEASGDGISAESAIPYDACNRLVEDAARPAVPAGSGGPGRRRGIREGNGTVGAFAPGPADPVWSDVLSTSPHLAPALSPVTAALAIALREGTLDLQAEIESDFCGLADGVARWLVERRPRLQCGGNGVVPLQAAAVFAFLARRVGLA